jgi:hypothetical protein
MKQQQVIHKYPDELTVDGGRNVRISQLSPNAIVKIHNHAIRVGDIPLTAAELKCGHVVRGVALQDKDIIFCEEDQANSFVVLILSQ